MRRFLFTILAVCIGCGSIPSVVFVPDDAGGATEDGGLEGGGDGALGDGTVVDSGALMCGSTPLPPGAICCAGDVACIGDCKPANLCRSDCNNAGCTGGKVCCRASGAVKCVTPGVDPCP